MVHAGVYSGVLHYLKSIEATGGKDTAAADRLDEGDADQRSAFRRRRRARRRPQIHDMYLFKVKAPADSKGPWDYYEKLATIPAAEAFRPLADGGCPLVQVNHWGRGRSRRSAQPIAGQRRCSSSWGFRRKRCSGSCCSG